MYIYCYTRHVAVHVVAAGLRTSCMQHCKQLTSARYVQTLRYRKIYIQDYRKPQLLLSRIHSSADGTHFDNTNSQLKKKYITPQYSETNVMHFLFSLLRIKGLCMFRALLAHPQEAVNKRYFVYCVRSMSVGCYQDWSGTGFGDTSSILILVAAN
jgi:hypothetical protein